MGIQRSEFSLSPSFVEQEELVSKIQLIQDFEQQYPYDKSEPRNARYFERCLRAINAIPREHHEAAWALFGNVVYLPKDLIDDGWPYLIEEAIRTLKISRNEIIDEGLLLELDAAGLDYDFLQRCRISGRLDTNKYPRGIKTVGSMIQQMKQLILSQDEELRNTIQQGLKKRFWILLVDNALSGTSLSSEISKIRRILNLIREAVTPPKVLILIQVMTEQAKHQVNRALRDDDSFDIRWYRAVMLDETFQINSPRCELFNQEETRRKVVRFCEWFAGKSSLSDDPAMAPTKKLSGDDLKFGFKATGLTLVTHNCPSNSVPALWYPTIDMIDENRSEGKPGPEYIPPFPRLHSRTKQAKSKDRDNLKFIEKERDKLLRALQ